MLAIAMALVFLLYTVVVIKAFWTTTPVGKVDLDNITAFLYDRENIGRSGKIADDDVTPRPNIETENEGDSSGNETHSLSYTSPGSPGRTANTNTNMISVNVRQVSDGDVVTARTKSGAGAGEKRKSWGQTTATTYASEQGLEVSDLDTSGVLDMSRMSDSRGHRHVSRGTSVGRAASGGTSATAPESSDKMKMLQTPLL